MYAWYFRIRVARVHEKYPYRMLSYCQGEKKFCRRNYKIVLRVKTELKVAIKPVMTQNCKK